MPAIGPGSFATIPSTAAPTTTTAEVLTAGDGATDLFVTAAGYDVRPESPTAREGTSLADAFDAATGATFEEAENATKRWQTR